MYTLRERLAKKLADRNTETVSGTLAAIAEWLNEFSGSFDENISEMKRHLNSEELDQWADFVQALMKLEENSRVLLEKLAAWKELEQSGGSEHD